MNTLNTIQKIKDNTFYKQIIADSFGGVMYDVANRNKYNEGKKALLALWEEIESTDAADGVMKGAMSFLRGD